MVRVCYVISIQLGTIQVLSVIYSVKRNWNFKAFERYFYTDVLTNSNSNIPAHFCLLSEGRKTSPRTQQIARSPGEGLQKNHQNTE